MGSSQGGNASPSYLAVDAMAVDSAASDAITTAVASSIQTPGPLVDGHGSQGWHRELDDRTRSLVLASAAAVASTSAFSDPPPPPPSSRSSEAASGGSSDNSSSSSSSRSSSTSDPASGNECSSSDDSEGLMAVGDFDEKSECHESNSGGGSSSPSAMMETAPLQRLRENLVLVRRK